MNWNDYIDRYGDFIFIDNKKRRIKKFKRIFITVLKYIGYVLLGLYLGFFWWFMSLAAYACM